MRPRYYPRATHTSFTTHLPWKPITCHMVPYSDGLLYRYRDDDGVDWWSDGWAIFRGSAPDYLIQDYRAAGLPVEDPREPVVVALFALVRKHPGVLLDAPIVASRFTRGWKHDAVPFAVFAASEHLPELLMDARCLAYVEQWFEDYALWRVNAAAVAVRNEDGRLLGIIEGCVGPLPVCSNQPAPRHRSYSDCLGTRGRHHSSTGAVGVKVQSLTPIPEGDRRTRNIGHDAACSGGTSQVGRCWSPLVGGDCSIKGIAGQREPTTGRAGGHPCQQNLSPSSRRHR